MIYFFKIFVVLLLFVGHNKVSIASDQINTSNKQVENLRKKYSANFDLIEKAIKEGNSDKVNKLIESLNQIPIKTESNSNIREFQESLSRDDIFQAKKLGYKLIESNKTSYTQKALIYRSLGDYFLYKDDLDNALIEYKKIIELPVNKSQ